MIYNPSTTIGGPPPLTQGRLSFFMGLRKARPNSLQLLSTFSPSRTRGLFPRLKGSNKTALVPKMERGLFLTILFFLQRTEESDYSVYNKKNADDDDYDLKRVAKCKHQANNDGQNRKQNTEKAFFALS